MVYKEDPDKWTFLPILTEVYSNSPKAKLNSKVPKMTWIKFFNILEKLNELLDELKEFGAPKPGVLETVMVNWLKDVAPEKVTPNNERAIHEFACAIGDKVSGV